MLSGARLLGQALWASGGQLLQTALAVVSMIVLVRILGAETYGIFVLGLLFTGFADVFVGGHTADILVQREAIARRLETAAFALNAAVGCLVGLVLVALAGPAAGWFDVPRLAGLLPVMAALPLLTALAAVPTQLLVRATRFATLAKTGTAAALVAVTVGVAMALAGAGVWSLVVMEIARRLTTLALVALAVR